MLRKHGFDEMDWVHNLYQRLMRYGYRGVHFHQVYADEVQDFTMGELRLLTLLCRDHNAMFFSGDTAQSITKGVGFRFSDIVSTFKTMKDTEWGQVAPFSIPKLSQLTHNYRTHAGVLEMAYSVVWAMRRLFPHSVDKLVPDKGLFPGPKPKVILSTDTEELAMLLAGSTKRGTGVIDFGAHQVILVREEKDKETIPHELRAGALVMTVAECKGLEMDDVLLYNFWRDSPAKKEWKALVALLPEEEERQQATSGGSGGSGSSSGQPRGRGGPKAAKDGGLAILQPEELPAALLRDGGDEVYDAFASSKTLPFSADHNVVGDHVPPATMKDFREGLRTEDTRFLSGIRLLESELKHLYVALTRARVNVWIFDEGDGSSGSGGRAAATRNVQAQNLEQRGVWARTAAFEYFQRFGLVTMLQTVKTEDDDGGGGGDGAAFAHSSTPEEWVERGRLFEKAGWELKQPNLYVMARKCYDKAAGLQLQEQTRMEALDDKDAEEVKQTAQRHERALQKADAAQGMFHLMSSQMPETSRADPRPGLWCQP